jgi:hypothetical protein
VHVDSYANSSSDDLFSKYAIDGFLSKDRLIELVQLEEKYYQSSKSAALDSSDDNGSSALMNATVEATTDANTSVDVSSSSTSVHVSTLSTRTTAHTHDHLPVPLITVDALTVTSGTDSDINIIKSTSTTASTTPIASTVSTAPTASTASMGSTAPNASTASIVAPTSSVFDKSSDELPPIRLISFDDFVQCDTFPRYPENKDITITLDEVMGHRDKSLIVFISHCWMRGYPGAMGYDRRPHPDNKEGSKYFLIVDGIRKIKKDLAPGMDFCYVWLDYGCMDQDGNPAGELKQLDKIVQACDCLFTPIHDPDWESWTFPNGLIKNIYEDYQAKLWNVGDFAYVNRAWCRVEMFYASNIPLPENSVSRVDNLRAGLKLHITNGVRPHMLYGDREVNRNIQPIILPPLQNSYYDRLDPKKGKLSVASDVVHIEQLIEELEPYKKIQKEGYEG